MFKQPSKSICTQTAVSPYPLSCIPAFSTMKTPGNLEKGPDDPEPADEGNIQIEYSSDWLYCTDQV